MKSPLLLRHFIVLVEVNAHLGMTNIYINWKVDYADQSVLFVVTQETLLLGYVIIGFSDHGSYNNSDICIYNEGKLRDGYIDGNFQIHFDRSQDCQLEKRQSNKFAFRRRFATCDSRDFAFETGTTQFIIAGGFEFTRDFSSSSVMKVMRYGVLIDMEDTASPEEPVGTHFKVLADDALIPNVVTTYWCIIERIPPELSNRKHHIVQVRSS
ncbi:unnamed protein product [Strongylus vulgaris]|uniref:DOMON domain-containing protein n=1 Tax=Strongylus vulgaris TaxID=40348 RepID=A0A3P7IW63_STRVU|nr:unnamed protein product [Strongylus vulgaris]